MSPRFLTATYLIVLLGMRLTRRWNQTGQKFAGSPDIARTFLLEHTSILWILICITYLWNLNSLVTVTFASLGRLLAGTSGSVLTTAALTFKLAFTIEDSPELLSGIARSVAGADLGISLVNRARIVFVSIGTTAFLTMVTGFGNFTRPNRKFHGSCSRA